jgi:hypothetical protein
VVGRDGGTTAIAVADAIASETVAVDVGRDLSGDQVCEIAIAWRPPNPGEYMQNHLDLHLTAGEAAVLRGCLAANEGRRLADGRFVTRSTDVIRLFLQKIGEAAHGGAKEKSS